jgi:glutamine amidotransferase-like uncharacterized protein
MNPRRILIYRDDGANLFCIRSLVAALKQEGVHERFMITFGDRTLFQETNWQESTELVILPGGRDVPYHEALQGLGNQRIKNFVQRGGKYLGICAGGYFGSSNIEFEKGGELEILATRELQFFPGTARGPAYGNGQFCYTSEQGAKVAKLQLHSPSAIAYAYYNGGCFFHNAEKYDNISILARYADIEDQPAALVLCKVHEGLAILSGIHPEYSTTYAWSQERIKGPIFESLKKKENERRTIFKQILYNLQVGKVNEITESKPVQSS